MFHLPAEDFAFTSDAGRKVEERSLAKIVVNHPVQEAVASL